MRTVDPDSQSAHTLAHNLPPERGDCTLVAEATGSASAAAAEPLAAKRAAAAVSPRRGGLGAIRSPATHP